MFLGNAWGLLGLLAIPAILAIHLFKQRYKPVPTTALFLYGPVPQTQTSGRTKQNIVWKKKSLWLELLTALALTWYLADPHFADRHTADHLVVILDSRMRLTAEIEPGKKSIDLLKIEVKRRLDELNRHDRVTVLESGEPAQMLTGSARRVQEAKLAIDQWQADQPYHRLRDALALAVHMTTTKDPKKPQIRGGKILLVTDQKPEVLPKDVGLLTLGKAQDTCGFSDVRWINDAKGERVLVRLSAFGKKPQTRMLKAFVPGLDRPVLAQQVTVHPNKPKNILFTPPLAGLEAQATLVLNLHGKDPLSFDDTAKVIRPPQPSLKVHVDLPGATAKWVHKALSIFPEVLQSEDPKAPVHLRITNQSPKATPGTWILRLAKGEAKPVLGPFLSRSGHPLLSDVDFTGVLWTGGATALPNRKQAALLSAGQAFLMSESLEQQSRQFTLYTDLESGTLANHSCWPVLFANLIAARKAVLPGPQQVNLGLGQSFKVILPTGAKLLKLERNGQEITQLQPTLEHEVLVPGLTQSGIYDLHYQDAKGHWQSPWRRVNILGFDARLSDLTGTHTSYTAPKEVGQTQVARSRSLAEHLLPIVLAGLFILGAVAFFGKEEGTTA